MTGYTLNDKHLDALRVVVEASKDTTSEVALPWELLEGLGELVGCDEAVFMGINYGAESHYFIQSSRNDQRVFETTFADGCATPFWHHFRTSTHRPPWIPDQIASVTKPTDFMSERQWRNLPLYVECFREGPKTSHELMMCLPDGFHRQLRLLLWRNPGREFTERERFDLQLLLPHVEAAYRRGERRRLIPQLTFRQCQLLEWVGEGYTNQQIARRMGLAEGTVRTHLNNIYARLGVTSRTEAVMRTLGLLSDLKSRGQDSPLVRSAMLRSPTAGVEALT